jgi:hypothetical protein
VQSSARRTPAQAPGKPYVPCSINAKTDSQGRFVFERVPPGSRRVFRVTNFHEGLPGVTGLSHHTEVEVHPGQTTEIVMGGAGRRVIGRIRTAPENAVADWTRDLQRLVRARPELTPPKESEFPDLTTYFQAWRKHDAAEAKYYLAVKPDGSFVVDDVPPGRYRLELRVTEPPPDRLGEKRYMGSGHEIGSLRKDVTIPAASTESGQEPFDLGTFTLELKASPTVRK